MRARIPERDAPLLALRFAAGERIADIARERRVSPATAWRTIRAAVLRGAAPARGQVPPEQARAMLRAHGRGDGRTLDWRTTRATEEAAWAAESARAGLLAPSRYVCSRCGRTCERFPTRSRIAEPPTMLGGKPVCPKCARGRFRALKRSATGGPMEIVT